MFIYLNFEFLDHTSPSMKDLNDVQYIMLFIDVVSSLTEENVELVRSLV